MSRNIPQTVVRLDREQLRRERELGKLVITLCPSMFGKKQLEEDDGRQSTPYRIAALIKQDRLAAVQIFSSARRSRIGTVYLGKIKKIVKNLNACFVEIADGEQCFMHMDTDRIIPFLTNRAYDGRLLEGDELLVQLEHEAIKTKQASVTAQITLQGEYFILSTGKTQAGISRKLSEARREQLRRLLEDWQITSQDGAVVQEEGVPPFGLVVRTRAGEADSEEALSDMRREYDRLRSQFTALFQQGRYRNCYSCLYEAQTALEEALGPFQKEEYLEIVTDLPQVYEELVQLKEQKRLSLVEKQLRLYQDDSFSLEKLYSLSARLEEALGRTVWLKSGANLVIEQTESLTAIDVNTGKCIKLPGDQSQADTVRRVNLEAAREVAWQLRLRNLSGIIIVDFINLATLDQEEELLQELRRLT
ncbi:MAG: ribonuclease E/G, partial [Acetatifactor sp.]|nr:ribonuclease E/G [Acetatifactor sp.]